MASIDSDCTVTAARDSSPIGKCDTDSPRRPMLMSALRTPVGASMCAGQATGSPR
jgi:hypothetical protein